MTVSRVPYRDLVQGARDGLILHTRGTITFANRAALGMVGWTGPEDGLVGHAMEDFLGPPWLAVIHDELVSPGSTRESFVKRPLTRMDGKPIAVEVSATAVIAGGMPSVQMTLRFATVPTAAPEAAGPWTSTPAIGQLAEGIAHELNNALAIISGNVALLRARAGGAELRELTDIAAGAARAADVVADLLALTLRDVHRPVAVAVNDVVRAAASLVALSVPDAVLNLRLDSTLPEVVADPGALARALASVARDTVRVATDPASPVIVTSKMITPAVGAETVRIEVGGDGPGMTAVMIERAFEPYAPTLEAAGRSGLALAVARGVVGRLGGTITVASADAGGTRVTIDLPSRPPDPAVGRVGPVLLGDVSERPNVLVVDDEPMLRRVAAMLVARLGYEAVTAGDGATAVELFSADPPRFAFALLDVSMRGMSGVAALARIQALDPDARAILCTGHPRETLDPATFASGRVQYLGKPFTMEELARLAHIVTGRLAAQ